MVLVDTSVIAQAPKRTLVRAGRRDGRLPGASPPHGFTLPPWVGVQVAGIGDALATFFEARTTFEQHGPNFLGGKGLLTGIALAELCYRTLLENAESACAAVEVCAGGTAAARRLAPVPLCPRSRDTNP